MFFENQAEGLSPLQFRKGVKHFFSKLCVLDLCHQIVQARHYIPGLMVSKSPRQIAIFGETADMKDSPFRGLRARQRATGL